MARETHSRYARNSDCEMHDNRAVPTKDFIPDRYVDSGKMMRKFFTLSPSARDHCDCCTCSTSGSSNPPHTFYDNYQSFQSVCALESDYAGCLHSRVCRGRSTAGVSDDDFSVAGVFYSIPRANASPDSSENEPNDQVNSQRFQIFLNVIQFSQNSIKVEQFDEHIEVRGKQEGNDGHGYILREFTRKYRIPDDVDRNTLRYCFIPEGVLYIDGQRNRECSKQFPGSSDKQNESLEKRKYARRSKEISGNGTTSIEVEIETNDCEGEKAISQSCRSAAMSGHVTQNKVHDNISEAELGFKIDEKAAQERELDMHQRVADASDTEIVSAKKESSQMSIIFITKESNATTQGTLDMHQETSDVVTLSLQEFQKENAPLEMQLEAVVLIVPSSEEQQETCDAAGLSPEMQQEANDAIVFVPVAQQEVSDAVGSAPDTKHKANDAGESISQTQREASDAGESISQTQREAGDAGESISQTQREAGDAVEPKPEMQQKASDVVGPLEPGTQQKAGDTIEPETKTQQGEGDAIEPETKTQQAAGDAIERETKTQQGAGDAIEPGAKTQQEAGDAIEPETMTQQESGDAVEPEPEMQQKAGDAVEPEPEMQQKAGDAVEPEPEMQQEAGDAVEPESEIQQKAGGAAEPALGSHREECDTAEPAPETKQNTSAATKPEPKRQQKTDNAAEPAPEMQKKTEEFEPAPKAQQEASDVVEPVLETQQEGNDAVEPAPNAQQEASDAVEPVLETQQEVSHAVEQTAVTQQEGNDAAEQAFVAKQKAGFANLPVSVTQQEANEVEPELRIEQGTHDAAEAMSETKVAASDTVFTEFRITMKQIIAAAVEKSGYKTQLEEITVTESHSQSQEPGPANFIEPETGEKYGLHIGSEKTFTNEEQDIKLESSTSPNVDLEVARNVSAVREPARKPEREESTATSKKPEPEKKIRRSTFSIQNAESASQRKPSVGEPVSNGTTEADLCSQKNGVSKVAPKGKTREKKSAAAEPETDEPKGKLSAKQDQAAVSSKETSKPDQKMAKTPAHKLATRAPSQRLASKAATPQVEQKPKKVSQERAIRRADSKSRK